MLPTKTNLKDEIKHRLSLIEKAMFGLDKNDFEYIILCNEHSQNTEFLSLIEIFENRIGFEQFEFSKFTPILDYETKEHLKIGDKVEDPNRKVCGTLIFDDYNNKYLIKTEVGGNHHTSTFKKIEVFYDYRIDSEKVECRARPHRKKW